MQYHVVACDYDGTIAHDGKVTEQTLAALKAIKASGRKLVLVTGRQIEDLFTTFAHSEIFDLIVAENGAVIYDPEKKETVPLATPPPAKFIEELKAVGVGPLAVGHVIVATWEPFENAVLQIIRELNLELQVIFNKGAVMVLPAGINKGSGLTAALKKLNLSAHNVIAVGDAENDHSFLEASECRVATGNALPALKDLADVVLARNHGEGIQDLASMLLESEDLFRKGPSVRTSFEIGTTLEGVPVKMSPYEGNILIAGSSGGGKSTFATTVLEQLGKQEYQFCIIDPEGDYAEFEHAKALGSSKAAASTAEVLAVLKSPKENVAVNMTGVRYADRPAYFLPLLSALHELRSRTGRPQWFLVDEAHHVLPAAADESAAEMAGRLNHTIFITMHPSEVLSSAMEPVCMFIGVGEDGPKAMAEWAKSTGKPLPELPQVELSKGTVLVWQCLTNKPPFVLKVKPNETERKRHRRKYAEGEIPKKNSFYFKGPHGALNLRAQNLIIFLQMAEGIDDETWLFHLNTGEYASWFEAVIKDPQLTEVAKKAQAEYSKDAASSRELIKKAIEEHYTLPAKPLSASYE